MADSLDDRIVTIINHLNCIVEKRQEPGCQTSTPAYYNEDHSQKSRNKPTIAIVKHEKGANKPESYCPIALLSTNINLLNDLFLTELTQHCPILSQ